MTKSGLTHVQMEILHLIAEGYSDREIAEARGTSLTTVRTHRDHIFAKIGCRNRVEATHYAYVTGLVNMRWPRTENRADA